MLLQALAVNSERGDLKFALAAESLPMKEGFDVDGLLFLQNRATHALRHAIQIL